MSILIEKLFSCKFELDHDQKHKQVIQYFESQGSIHKQLKVIHITGTAGKGSTAAMIASGLQKANYNVGLMTSPHLIDVTERIKINNQPISQEQFESYLSHFFEILPGLSFNMYITLIATQYFYDEGVDFFVCEVFVGGLLDTTNIYDNIVTILTSLGLDHKHLLGETKEAILEQKLGIMRSHIPLFTRVEHPLIQEKVKEVGSVLHHVIRTEKTNLEGFFQEENAGIAFEVLSYLGIDEDTSREALQQVEWLGRVQRIEKNILVDSAHNPLSFRRLFEYVESLEYENLYILFAFSGQRTFADYEPYLLPSKDLVFTKPSIFKAQDPSEYAPQGSTIILEVKEAYNYLKDKLTEQDLLLVCGSVFLAGEIVSLEGMNK